jgi:hypothetical protein
LVAIPFPFVDEGGVVVSSLYTFKTSRMSAQHHPLFREVEEVAIPQLFPFRGVGGVPNTFSCFEV